MGRGCFHILPERPGTPQAIRKSLGRENRQKMGIGAGCRAFLPKKTHFSGENPSQAGHRWADGWRAGRPNNCQSFLFKD
jgi:hypothetical protein